MHEQRTLGPALPPSPGPPAGLSWARTVDRRLVHRNALAEVLLTDIRRVDRTTFAVAAQWPRSHRVYRPDPAGRPDPMLLLETVRQVGLAVSHHGFGVGDDQRALMAEIGFELWSPAAPPPRPTALDLAIEVRCTDIRTRQGVLSRLTVELTCHLEGHRFAGGSGTVNWLSATSYRALRRRARPAPTVRASHRPAPSPSAGRSGSDALIAVPDADFPRRRLLVPLDHPVYFDHPLDHVPGLLLVDAAWQAASQLLPAGRRLLAASMRCPAFTELFPIALIELRPVAEDVLGFEVEQSDRVTSTGTLRFSRSEPVSPRLRWPGPGSGPGERRPGSA